MDKTCNKCACDKVCNHDIYGFESCGNFMPAEDVVEVVRCRDCKKHYKDGFCDVFDVRTKAKDYCSYGEMRSN